MKKTLALVLALLMTVAVFAGCEGNEKPTNSGSGDNAVVNSGSAETPAPVEKTTMRLGGLKGPTTMGMAKLINDASYELTENNYEYTMAGTADELTPKLIQGELDAIAAPINLCSTLYNKTNGGVKLVAVNALGVLYIVEKGGETINSFADLKGKTIYATAKGMIPEYALSYLLAQNGIDIEKDVTMEWKTEATEVVALMSNQESAIAMLPQPFVTVAQSQVEGLRVALDLTAEWDRINADSRFVTAGIIVRTEFMEKNPEAFEIFMKEYAASTAFVNSNPKEASVMIEELGIVKAAIAERAIPFCNIVCMTGAEMKAAASGYLTILHGQNPKAVGEKLPDDNFYYEG